LQKEGETNNEKRIAINSALVKDRKEP